MLAVGAAGLMAASAWARAAILPWAMVLQVTPIVAIAPLIIVWVGDPFASLVVCATIVAFFPVFSNTAAGLAAVPPELLDLFRLNGAGRWQTLTLAAAALGAALFPGRAAGVRRARAGRAPWWPSSWPGPAGSPPGLAYRILEAGYRLQIPRMFAALVLLSVAGIAINFLLGGLEAWLLRRRGAA